MNSIEIKIKLPIGANINAHGDVDIDYTADEALKAVQDAINRDADDIRSAILAEAEERAAEWREDIEIEECIEGRT